MHEPNLQKIEENFLLVVQNHTLEIEESGLVRYLKFRNKNGSSTHHFNITTWPGYLAITGDKGNFVFAKEPDMFEFFRGKLDSVDYISEKLVAEDKNRAKVFSQKVLVDSLKELTEDYRSSYSVEQVNELLEDLLFNVGNSETKEEAIIAIHDYQYKLDNETVSFDADFYPSYMEYSYQYLTCLIAIYWGIQEYYKLQENKGKLINGTERCYDQI